MKRKRREEKQKRKRIKEYTMRYMKIGADLLTEETGVNQRRVEKINKDERRRRDKETWVDEKMS